LLISKRSRGSPSSLGVCRFGPPSLKGTTVSRRRNLQVAVLAVAALVLAGVMLFPPLQASLDSDTDAPTAPDLSSTVVASGARVVLPPVAGGAARIYLTIANTGTNTVHLNRVALEHASAVTVLDTDTPDAMEVTALPIEPGAKVELAPGGRFALAARYGEDLVPGRSVELALTFGSGPALTLPATVEAGTGQNGAPRPLPASPDASEGQRR
jgi:copper(I)-binding protein